MKSPRLTLFLTTKSNTLLVKSVLMSKNGRSCKKWQKLKKNGRSWFIKSNSLFNSTSYMLADCLHPNFAELSSGINGTSRFQAGPSNYIQFSRYGYPYTRYAKVPGTETALDFLVTSCWTTELKCVTLPISKLKLRGGETEHHSGAVAFVA